MKGKIRVFCRLRPLNAKEVTDKEKMVLTNLDEFTIEHLWKDDKQKQYLYDRVFDCTASQDDVFEDTKVCSCVFIHPLIETFTSPSLFVVIL